MSPSPLRASLNYLAPSRGPVRTYAFDPPGGGPRFDGRLQAHTVPVHDARARPAAPSLDAEGFMCCPHRSALADLWDEDALRGAHYAEVERLLRALTGARHVVVFDHTLRRRPPGRPPLDGSGGSFAAVRTPVGRVHVDYTPVSGPARARQVLGDAPPGPFAILGVWRPTRREPLLDAPLALADARSVCGADLVTNELVYPDRRGQTFAAMHSAGHRWFYVPRMARDEVVVFKHWDSRRAVGEAGGVVPHTAFDDPTAPPDAPPRESLELRALALF